MCCCFLSSLPTQSIIGTRMLEGKWNIDLLGIQIDGTFNPLVVLWLHQSPKNVCSRSNHKAQSQWHSHRRHTRWAAQASTTSIQRDLVPHHCHTHQSLTLPWLIKLLQLHQPTQIKLIFWINHTHRLMYIIKLKEFIHSCESYVSGSNDNFWIGQIQRRGCDMNPEECSRVAISEFDGGIHGDHVGGDAGGIGTRLDSEMVEFYALRNDQQPEVQKKKKKRELRKTHLRGRKKIKNCEGSEPWWGPWASWVG